MKLQSICSDLDYKDLTHINKVKQICDELSIKFIDIVMNIIRNACKK